MKRYIWISTVCVLLAAAVGAMVFVPYFQIQTLKQYEQLPPLRLDTVEIDVGTLEGLLPGEKMTLSDGAELCPLEFEDAVRLGGQTDDYFKKNVGLDPEFWIEAKYSLFLYQKIYTMDGTADCPYATRTKALFFINKDNGKRIAEVLPLDGELASGKGDCRWEQGAASRNAEPKQFPAETVVLFNMGQLRREFHLPLGFGKIGGIFGVQLSLPLTWYSDTQKVGCRYVCV